MFDLKKFFRRFSAVAQAASDQSVVSPAVKHSAGLKKDTMTGPLTPPTQLDAVQQALFNGVENTNANIFVQGQAGTGKSAFVQYLKDHTRKDFCVACPTAIAALNIGGVTLHSLFRLPFGNFFILEKLKLAPKTKKILQKKICLSSMKFPWCGQICLMQSTCWRSRPAEMLPLLAACKYCL